MNLPANLRAKLHMVGDTMTLGTIDEFINYLAMIHSSTDNRADALEGDASSDIILLLDQSPRLLKDCIVRDEAAEKSIEHLRIAIRISKRVALAELKGRVR